MTGRKRLFLVTRIGEADYDQYRGAVVRATSAAEAIDMVAGLDMDTVFNEETLEPIGERPAVPVEHWRASVLAVTGPAAVILADFRAG